MKYKTIARKIQEFHHASSCDGDSQKCANYPCDLLNYPIEDDGK